jgi:predicted GH43/DUF377 family glycosyl hydrolase
MDKTIGRDIIRRWRGNPLITPRDLSFQCSDICNAGVAQIGDEVRLLVTVEALEGYCHLHVARSKTGQQFWMSDRPLMRSSDDPHFREAEGYGVRDARVTPMDGTYYITYVAQGQTGFRVALARTDDFETIERIGVICEPDTKSGALFPRKIDGRYAMLTRPEQGGSIWLSTSDDLIYLGRSEVVMTPRGGFWDADKIGTAGPPIEIDRGWLLIYYG